MASSKRSTRPAKSSPATSPAPRATSTSSPTTSTSTHTSWPVVIALGSNLGDRELTLRRAVEQLGRFVRIVRVSSIYVTDPVDAPAGSPRFLNMVVAGLTSLAPQELLRGMMAIEDHLGRRRTVRNAPRTIDLDLIFYSARLMRTKQLTLPHPRYREREFVLGPLRELGIYAQRVP